MFHGSSFSFFFGSGLLVKVWFVFIVFVLEVTPRIASMLHVFSSIIHTQTAKYLHEAGHLVLFPSTSGPRQFTGTLYTHHFALPRCFLDWVSVLLSMDSICLSGCGLSSSCWFWRFLDFYVDFPQRFTWFYLICLFVYIICLGGTWWVILFTVLSTIVIIMVLSLTFCCLL